MLTTNILERFSGTEGRRNVIEALRRQSVIKSKELAEAIADAAVIGKHDSGESLFLQGDASNDAYFILAGSLLIRINGRQIAIRSAGQHVGEMSAIDPHALRSASVIALGNTVTAKVTEPDFTSVATRFPELWRELASELAERIRQRSAQVALKNSRPQVFIGSSVEGLAIARAIQSGLQYDNFDVKLWSDSVFNASKSTLADLENAIENTDFGVLIFTNDDKIESRGHETSAPRDNVILELGMLLGAIGSTRTFFVHRRGVPLKIPSDLFGISPITHGFDGTGDVAVGLAPVCNELRLIIARLGAK